MIPVNKEAVLGIQLCESSPKKRIPRINIMDSNSFLMGSLDQLAHRLFADGHHMSILKASRLCQDNFGKISLQKFNLLTRKGNVARFHIILFLINAGVFPYEFLTSRSVLKETKLPPIEIFSSSLVG